MFSLLNRHKELLEKEKQLGLLAIDYELLRKYTKALEEEKAQGLDLNAEFQKAVEMSKASLEYEYEKKVKGLNAVAIEELKHYKNLLDLAYAKKFNEWKDEYKKQA